MKRLLAMVLALGLVWVGQVSAQERGTKEQAMELVKKALAAIKADGKDKAMAEFNNNKGAFVDRDLYVVAVDFNGKVLAHGANARLVGKDLTEIKDADGKAFVKEQIEIAKTKGNGWMDFKFTNPVSKQIEPRSFYVQRVEDYYIGAGIFKP